MQISKSSEISILLVEDDEVDIESFRRMLKKQRILNPIHVACDGLEAFEFLRGSAERKKIERPFLIILDLNMPRMNGIEFLEELRQDEELHDSICFVLTTSDACRDKVAAYDKHIAGYLVKSQLGKDFARMLDLIECYWRIVHLPPDPNGIE